MFSSGERAGTEWSSRLPKQARGNGDCKGSLSRIRGRPACHAWNLLPSFPCLLLLPLVFSSSFPFKPERGFPTALPQYIPTPASAVLSPRAFPSLEPVLPLPCPAAAGLVSKAEHPPFLLGSPLHLSLSVEALPIHEVSPPEHLGHSRQQSLLSAQTGLQWGAQRWVTTQRPPPSPLSRTRGAGGGNSAPINHTVASDWGTDAASETLGHAGHPAGVGSGCMARGREAGTCQPPGRT